MSIIVTTPPPDHGACARAIAFTWPAGHDESTPVELGAEFQGNTYDYVSGSGTNGTITVSVDDGATFNAPPFTVGTDKVAFRRTTYAGEGSALFEV